MTVTLWDIRSRTYWILREEQDSQSYPLFLIDDLTNWNIFNICAWLIINNLTKDKVSKGHLPFIRTETYFKNQPWTTLTSDTNIWDTILNVWWTDNFPNSWYIFIWWSVITYTWKTSLTFTWCSWVNYTFPAWMQVSITFSVPTDYMSIINITYQNKFKLESKVYDDIYEDLNRYKWNYRQRSQSASMYASPYNINPFYVIKDKKYITIFNLSDINAMMCMRYEKKHPLLVNETDEVLIDVDQYATNTIPYLNAWKILMNRGEEERGSQLLTYWIWELTQMYRYYTNSDFESQNWVQVKAQKGKRLNL